MSMSVANLLRHAIALRREGRKVIGCLLIKARGSTPQSAGALMLVDEAANTLGTIGGGCVEAEVRRQAFQMLGNGTSGVVEFTLDHDYGWDDGLICGGTLHLAIGPLPDVATLEQIVTAVEHRTPTNLSIVVDGDPKPVRYTLHMPPRERLYIAGGGHVGQAVARLALQLDFEVTIFDDRRDMLDRFAPEGARTVAGDIADELHQAFVDDGTYCLVVTRGHRHDEQALHAVIARGARYVGMIGSRRKVKLIFDDLVERGVERVELERVHAPVGLDIGAVSVEEIAVSIVAQLVQVRRRYAQPIVSGPVDAEAIGRTAATEAAAS
jgi:xanthine dehydrogenase accessory factor